ncbi:MAG: dihydroneopterin aldolase [Micrococcus sp.]|nr:dihydroneopterin aldolase [Micrococcus sp.]
MTEWTHQPVQQDRIRLTGLRAYGYHGVLDHERRDGQLFITDVVMHADVAEAAAHDDLAKTVNYADVAETVIGVVTGEAMDLIETLADRVARAILAEQPLTNTVEVTVRKPQAPLPHDFTDVQVSVVRTRQALDSRRATGNPSTGGGSGQ